ncbi:PadR family transcriptional regulator [Microbispora catharanthi]|uniref:PadR family transcriptional regulator n=1 Tax=Microbispora catharanthi TaxID=1712871 RepID=A0A5N6BPR2_9ACTN|nr:PadR family transcriptional regulator [Microbispora catharanthi]KAB8182554.1 PadR family transcriptional regulator [Microbispora catharanthi]
MARGRADRDLVGLTVLALLSVRPAHPYELHRFVIDTHKDYISGLPRSLYHAVDRLAREELIAPVETSREGRRPERTVYQVTEEGRAELGTRLRRLLEQPDGDTKVFVAAVSLMGCLPVPEAERALGTRAATLEGAIVSADAHIEALTGSGLPRVLLLEVEYDRAMKAAELEWVRATLAEIRSGQVSWSADSNSGQLDRQ